MYILAARIAAGLDLGNRRDEIAFVDDPVAEDLETFAEPGDPERGRAHVDAAPVAAEVERHADDVNGTGRIGLTADEELAEPAPGAAEYARRRRR